MAKINIRRDHALGKEKARDMVSDLAEHLSEKLDLALRWDDDVLFFERSGVAGEIVLDDDNVHVIARLSLLLSPLKSTFEKQINDYLDQHLTA